MVNLIEVIIVLDGGFTNLTVDSIEQVNNISDIICSVIDEPNKAEHKFVKFHTSLGLSVIRTDKLLGMYTRHASQTAQQMADAVKKIADAASQGDDWKSDE